MDTSIVALGTQSIEVEMMLKRKSDDVGWNYCNLVDAKNKDKVQCIKCGKKISGGVYRIKEHIAHIKGNVSSCTKASKEDQELCRNAINEVKRKKKKKNDEGEELRSPVNLHKGHEEDAINVDQLQESFGSTKSPRSLGPMDEFANQISPDVCLSSRKTKLWEQNSNDELLKQRSETVKEYICRWAYEAGISFDSLELDSFKMMVEAIGHYGPGLIPPTRYEMADPFLKKEVDRTKNLLKSHEEEWKLKGCSIMIDAWSDGKRKSTMNLYVNSRLGTVFHSSKEYSIIAHTNEVLFEYVDKCIEEVGPDNVVQIVTNNASNNMGVAKLLKVKRPKIFWTSCAAHTIDLMLENIAKLPRFKKVIDQAKSLTVFLYTYHEVLVMMRSHTKKRDIVKPGVTLFATTFLTLQSLHKKRTELKTMFGSPEWEVCKFSKCVKGKDAYTTVMSMRFWSGVGLCLQVFTPLIKVLRIANGDKRSSMSFLYGELVQAKEEIKFALNNLPKNYDPIIEVIDAHIKDKLDSPLHLMAYLLNPFYHYKSSLLYLDQDISLSVLDCLDVLFFGDIDLQDKIMSEEFPKYRDKMLTFGKALVVKSCSVNDAKFDPVSWWMNFGAITPNLQRLAIKILSLTTSSSGCEKNQSAFEGVHSKKMNRLDTNLVNNLVFVQFNARLLSKQKKEKDRSESSNVDILLSNDSTRAQEWLPEGIDDDGDDDLGDVGGHSSPTSIYQNIRELYDDEFESKDEKINVNDVGDE